MSWKLIVLQGGRPKVEFPITREPLTIGRDKGCDITEQDDYVSRRHCQLVAIGGALFVVDNGSRNGVCVNGERVVGTREVQAGDCIGVGRAIYCVGARDAPLAGDDDAEIDLGVIPCHVAFSG